MAAESPAPRGDSFARGEEAPIRPEGGRRQERKARARLVHPATAEEFRGPLEAILDRLPAPLVQAIADEGYQVHVVDLHGPHPLTLAVEAFDLETLRRRAPDLVAAWLQGELPLESPVEECSWDASRSLREVARERGAESPEQEAEAVGLLLALNPDLAVLADLPGESPVPAGQRLLAPAFRYWKGHRLLCGAEDRAWEFLTRPLRSFVAGMVTHGRIPGLAGEENRIVFWDVVFRRGDGLADWYVLHEMGHTTDFAFAFRRPQAWRDWQARLEAARRQALEEGRLVTRYAGESATEYLAEGFAAWATPPGHRSPGGLPAGDLAEERRRMDRPALEERDPALAALIAEAVAVLGG